MMITNVVADYGNSAIKVGVFQDNHLIEVFRSAHQDIFCDIAEQYQTDNVVYCSVVDRDATLDFAVLGDSHKVWSLSCLPKLPFVNQYQTPDTLGQDRLSVVCGGINLFPNQNVLMIDIGTCITYDFVNTDREYLGGSISLGIDTRYQAIHDYTDRLPLLAPEPIIDVLGRDTQANIHSGVFYGICFEISGMIDYYQEQYEDVKIILTGGGASFFVKKLKNEIFARPNLVLEGMNHLLDFNVNV